MVRKISRRQFAIATAAATAGLVMTSGSASSQQRNKETTGFLARIEDLEIRKGGDGNPYTIVVYRILQQVGGPPSGKEGAPGQRHVIVKKGEPPKGAAVGARIVVRSEVPDLGELLYPGALVPVGQDPMPFCCIPIIIIIIGDAPRPDPDPPEGGEGTDPDKDDDEDEDEDVDTDGFTTW